MLRHRTRSPTLSPCFDHSNRTQALQQSDAAGGAQEGEGRQAMRPFHNGRHTSITNASAAGVSPAALMARAGHSDFKKTQGYIDLAGETFREEAELADARMFGAVDQKSGQN